jgi:hypothetical protein
MLARMPYLRLRQIALVARDLGPVEHALTTIFATGVCFRDPGVAKYGLHNALWALGGSFLEVVAPAQPGTAAGRYLERRAGDGGYMFIVDCDDLPARRAHLAGLGVRIVEDLRAGDADLWSEALHLHPKDTGGCLLSLDRHAGGADVMAGYLWAGPAWQAHARPDVAITGAMIQCVDPAVTAARWSQIFERPLVGDALRLDNAVARFVPLADDRGEGLSHVMLSCADPTAMITAARALGAPAGADWIDLAGVRFVFDR